MQWTVGKIGDALKVGAPFSLVHQRVAGFSIDSRTLKPGQVFFALKGPHHDGHDHVEEALQRGAVICIVSDTRRMTYPPVLHKSLIGCPDTFEAFQQLARSTRRTWGRILVGVTGSMGKTTTKEMLAALLATKYKLLKNEGNLNNEYGVPLTLLRLERAHELAVLEMAMGRKGELAKLCAVAEPNIGLVTNVAPVHLEFFSSLDEIAEAKRELLQGLAAPAIAVLNADDERVRRFAEGFRGKVLRFGSQDPANVRLENLADNGCLGTEFDLVVGAPEGRGSFYGYV
ncbi:MAG: UDP-N-acetylmuramoyl-tripeptide--D-alanyl-D-alanine ligase, partial [Terriglobia bacterium]